jgi:hypothetical protein
MKQGLLSHKGLPQENDNPYAIPITAYADVINQ